MEPVDSQLASRLESSPAFLLLGQNYSRLDDGEDHFLNRVEARLKSSTDHTYRSLLGADIGSDPESFMAWMQRVSDDQPIPAWLDEVASFPWSGLYLSAIDVMWNRAFRRPWRDLERVFEEHHYPLDPRNRLRLHATVLFGSVDQVGSLQPPLNRSEFLRRKQKAVSLLSRLPELVTPFGTLVIEALNPEADWLDSETLYPTLSQFGHGQVHLFGGRVGWDDELLGELVQKGVIVIHEATLADTFSRLRSEGELPEKDEGAYASGHRVRVGKRTYSIPERLYIEVSRSAKIVEETLFQAPASISPEAAYQDYRSFLADSAASPIWSGYRRGFAFRRPFEDHLMASVQQALTARESPSHPIILHGPTGTGKTVALGNLVYSLSNSASAPIVFIGRKSQLPDRQAVDEFLQWCETTEANKGIVVWDGMLDPSQYQEFLNFWLYRGRRLLLIGSSYRIAEAASDSHIEASDNVGESESRRFNDYLSHFVSDSGSIARQLSQDGASFLSLLYRILDPARPGLRRGVREELAAAELRIKSASAGPIEENLSSLGLKLLRLGLYADVQPFSGPPRDLEGESINPIEDFAGLICTPGQYGLAVPVDLLLRAIGESENIDLAKILDTIDIFRWREDEAGNAFVSARHALEARIVLRDRFASPEAEMDFAARLVNEAEPKWDHSPEEQFIVDLLRNLGPNGADANRYSRLWLTLVRALECLRTNKSILSPRLMLQEAVLRREYVKANALPSKEARELLSSGEVILEEAITLSEKTGRSRLQSVLRAELATNLGYQMKKAISEAGSEIDPRSIFARLQQHIIESRDLSITNVNPLDILGWTSEDLLNSALLSRSERLEVEAWVMSMFDLLNWNDLDEGGRERVMARLQSLYQTMSKEELSESMFDALLAEGSTAGIYVRARSILGQTHSADGTPVINVPLRKATVEFLARFRAQIAQDPKSLTLLILSWWIVKTGRPLLEGERQAVALSRNDWRYLWDICRDLLATGDNRWAATAKYVSAVALFHMEDWAGSFDTFRDLESDVDYDLARRRLQRTYLASTEQGAPRTFEGTVRWINEGEGQRSRGSLYVPEIRREIPFFPREFPRGQIRTQESLTFHIGFNFRGPIADPIGRVNDELG